MSREQFCINSIGKPWKYRACTPDAMDCWGLVVLYYRSVLGIELHQTDGYEADKDFVTCYQGNVLFWNKIDIPENDCIFIGYIGNSPAHVGVIIDSGALHSRGEGGCVRYDKLRAIERNFTKLEFLRYGHC